MISCFLLWRTCTIALHDIGVVTGRVFLLFLLPDRHSNYRSGSYWTLQHLRRCCNETGIDILALSNNLNSMTGDSIPQTHHVRCKLSVPQTVNQGCEGAPCRHCQMKHELSNLVSGLPGSVVVAETTARSFRAQFLSVRKHVQLVPRAEEAISRENGRSSAAPYGRQENGRLVRHALRNEWHEYDR